MDHKREVILLNISGEDKPGLTSALTDVLAQYNVNILDIGQAVIHQDLGLGILFEVPATSESSPILKDLLFKAYEIGLNVKFTPVTEEQYKKWVDRQGKKRYIITLLSPKLTALQLAAVTKEIVDQNLNIDIISRLSGRIPLD
ncbi:MAG: ACT domain-containing protein, partial [Bacteroidota bacterium]